MAWIVLDTNPRNMPEEEYWQLAKAATRTAQDTGKDSDKHQEAPGGGGGGRETHSMKPKDDCHLSGARRDSARPSTGILQRRARRLWLRCSNIVLIKSFMKMV